MSKTENKRERALKWIRVHGYHDERASALRIWVENRMSRAEMERAYDEGRNLKTEGMPCACPKCVN